MLKGYSISQCIRLYEPDIVQSHLQVFFHEDVLANSADSQQTPQNKL